MSRGFRDFHAESLMNNLEAEGGDRVSTPQSDKPCMIISGRGSKKPLGLLIRIVGI